MNLADQFERVFPWLIPLWIALVLGGLVLYQWYSHHSLEHTLRRAAQLYGGSIRKGMLFKSWSSMEIPRGNTCVTASFWPGVNELGTHTSLSFVWSRPPLRCEIFPDGFWTGLRKLMGMRDATIGNPQFDAEFAINTDDERGAREMLQPAVQSAIFGIDRFVAAEAFGQRCLHIQIGGGRIAVTVPRMLREYAAMAEFVRLGLAFHDACHESCVDGINFLEASSATSAHCMVCGEKLLEDIVHCRRCQTPHHRECWSYCGGCSTYGCGAKVPLEAQPAAKAG